MVDTFIVFRHFKGGHTCARPWFEILLINFHDQIDANAFIS